MPDYIVQELTRIDVITSSTQGLPGIQGKQGVAGPPGGTGLQYPAAGVLSGQRVVMLNADSKLVYASADNVAHFGRVIGVTLGAADAGQPCTVQNFDRMTEAAWTWTVNEPIFLGTDGHLTQVAPTAGFLMVVGFAISPTTLFVSLRDPILLS